METIERTDIRWHIGLAIGALCVSASAVLLGLADSTSGDRHHRKKRVGPARCSRPGLLERRHNGGLGVLLAGGLEHAVRRHRPDMGHCARGRGRAVLLRLPVPVAPRRSGRPAVADVRRGAGVVDCRRGGRGVRVAQSGHLTRLADGRVADRGHRDRPVARVAACGVLHSAASQRCRVRPATAHPDRCRRPRIVGTRRAALGAAAGGLRAGAGRELRRDCPP